MSFYEYLRKLYIKEIYLLGVCTLSVIFIAYFYLHDNNLAVLATLALLPMAIELIMLMSHKNISDYKPLVAPRTLHFITFYSIIVFISLVYKPLKFEFLLFIPLGISGMNFHPYFGKKISNSIYALGFISAIFLAIRDIFIDPSNVSFYLSAAVVCYTFALTAIFIYQSMTFNEVSKQILVTSKTGLKESLEKLQKSNRELDSFVFQIVHNFRGSLTSIEADFELISTAAQSEYVKNKANEGKKSTARLEYQIDKLTSHSMNQNRAEMTSPVDVNKLVMDVISDKYEVIEQNNIDFQFEPYSGDIFYSDRDRLLIILENLIDNSVKYIDHSKVNHQLHIHAIAQDNGLILQIQDNGIGIAKDHLPNIYNLFYRGTPHANGNGLGLYIVNDAVEKLGGSITVNSTEGERTMFSVFLPSVKILQSLENFDRSKRPILYSL